ncbi:MAG TPA: vanadium-dependent haloperoxidase [Chitinophagaceae bacterium]|nr:vanadium-dependent haloperoxidase [Chitinophagaceae bacterium]
MMIPKTLFCLLLLAVIAGTSCSKSTAPAKSVQAYSGAAVLYWNEVAYEAFGGTQYQHSLMASRINALVHLAMHDAVNGVEERYERYAFTGKDAEAHPVAAVASAAHAILLKETPGRKGYLDSALAQSLATVPAGEARDRGIVLGSAAAEAVLAKRAGDGSAGDPVNPVPPSNVPGVYQPVPPFDFAFALNWENVQPFALERKDQFRVAPHPALNSAAYAEAFREVKENGKRNSSTRTPDQLAYARYWYEFSEAGWNRVARVASEKEGLSLPEAARLFALVDMAMADAYIAGWDSKIHYNFWRPFTAIRQAGTDGNEATAADAAWESEMPTPPIHDYPSTHSALGNAAATVLSRLLGSNTGFTMSSPTAVPEGAVRSFPSFRQAADENADSRVQAGLHFRFSCVAGQSLGDKIGNWVVDHALQPVK